MRRVPIKAVPLTCVKADCCQSQDPGKPLQMLILPLGYWEAEGDDEIGLQTARHRETKGQQIVESCHLRPRVPVPSPRFCQFLERELNIEDQIETFEAVTCRVEAKKEQFILWERQLPAGLPMEAWRAEHCVRLPST